VSKFGEELIESLKQAAAHASGDDVQGMRVIAVELLAAEREQPRIRAARAIKETK
jgi:hypothetical protein